MLRSNDSTGHQVALTSGHGDGEDALATTVVLGILAHRRTLAVALLGKHEKVAVAVGNLHAQHPGVTLESDAANA